MTAVVRSVEDGMQRAIWLGKQARVYGMRPFGTVIADADGVVLSEALGSETTNDPTRHSEMLAIRKACRVKQGLLYGCTIYQTHEPCIMCCGAINHAKISRIAWGSDRRDLPKLFRNRNVSAAQLLVDTSTPAEVIIPSEPVVWQCLRLFDAEIADLEAGVSTLP